MRATTDLSSPQTAAHAGAQLQDQIAAHLRQMILDGRIPPGGRLMEVQVAKTFGVSRSPARRALEILREQELIREHPTRGYLVSGSSRNDKTSHFTVLEPVKLVQSRQWELMYSEVEQHLFAAVLFGSVRINDQRLAEHFGVSRTVTRDLLARMHGLGLISKDKAGHWMAQRVTPERVRHLFEMRKLLEPYLLQAAALHVPSEVLLSAKNRIFLASSKHPVDSRDFDHAETDLHVTILNFAPNKEMLGALHRTHLLFGPTRYLLDPVLGIPTELIKAALDEHLRIIDFLIDGKAASAASVLNRHIEAAIDRWLRRFETTQKKSDFSMPPYLTRF